MVRGMQTLMRLQRIRIAPRKMRMVIDLVRGKKVGIAKDVLRFSKTRGARILLRFLDSAIATAKSLGQGDESSLMVLKIAVDEGPKLKRFRARAKGSAYPIQKKVSHITLILDEVKGVKSAQTAVKETKATQEFREEEKEPGAISNARQGRLAKSLAKAKQFAFAPKTPRGIQRFFRKSGEK